MYEAVYRLRLNHFSSEKARTSDAMSENTTYPLIDPTTYDLIVVGTGLSESIIAAAASTVGKSVLHLDPNSFYGSHFSSLTLDEFTSFLTSHSTSTSHPDRPSSDDHDFIDIHTRTMYSEVEITCHAPEPLEHSRKFSLDVSGPRVIYCADESIDVLLKSGASSYVEFKSVDASFVSDDEGKLSSVPDSRAAIFKDKTLSLTEKNQLMRFFKLVQQHLAARENGGDGEGLRISEEDMESPFVDYLKKLRLPVKIKSAILYAIAMADYDQDCGEACKETLKTKDGIDRLAIYHQSVGRFSNALGALIYPLYGQGELPQAFCRRAAVKGCIHVLRMPIIAMLLDKSGGCYKGIRLASGQDIFSSELLLDPSFVVPFPVSPPPPNFLQESCQDNRVAGVKGMVARGVCITSSSLKPDVLSFLVIYPPRSLYPEQTTAVRVLQIGSNVAVCPPGKFLLYISALCDETKEGKRLLHAAVDALLSLYNSGKSETNLSAQKEITKELSSPLLWSAFYIQELSMGTFEGVGFTSMPDGNLDYNHVVNATTKLFQKMYPGEEFFPEAVVDENSDECSNLALEDS